MTVWSKWNQWVPWIRKTSEKDPVVLSTYVYMDTPEYARQPNSIVSTTGTVHQTPAAGVRTGEGLYSPYIAWSLHLHQGNKEADACIILYVQENEVVHTVPYANIMNWSNTLVKQRGWWIYLNRSQVNSAQSYTGNKQNELVVHVHELTPRNDCEPTSVQMKAQGYCKSGGSTHLYLNWVNYSWHALIWSAWHHFHHHFDVT